MTLLSLYMVHYAALLFCLLFVLFFFFKDAFTNQIYTLSLHDALPILEQSRDRIVRNRQRVRGATHSIQVCLGIGCCTSDRKSTRLNSSHLGISYAVFCLKKQKKQHKRPRARQRSQQLWI